MPTGEQSLSKRVEQLEWRLAQLERQATPLASLVQGKQPRLARTIDDGDYPAAPADTFPFIFVDGSPIIT